MEGNVQIAEINIGLVKTTPNQLKKHYTQFTKMERFKLRQAVSEIDLNRVWSSKHLKHKDVVTYKFDDIKDVIHNNNIIEYNITDKGEKGYDKRVVLRGRKEIETNKGKMNLCVVVSLKNMAIVTVYYNSSEINTHKKVHMDRYNSNLRVEI